MLFVTFSVRLALIAGAMLIASNVIADAFKGTWSSNYGELRIHQTAGVIIGDYAGVGVLLGEVVDKNCAVGTFTNDGRTGDFTFRVVKDGGIIGRYRWADGSGAAAWNAERISPDTPKEFTNFTRTNSGTVHIQNAAHIFSGVYSSPFGELRLRDSDLFLFGDYADRGIVAARWNGSSYEGIFTNRQLQGEQVGWLNWNADVLAQDLSGGDFEIIDGKQGQWPLAEFEPGEPTLSNLKIEGACAPLWPF